MKLQDTALEERRLPTRHHVKLRTSRHLKATTRDLIRRRNQIAEEFARTPNSDWIESGAELFSGIMYFAGCAEEQKMEEDRQIDRRKRWLIGLFPHEMWRMPTFTGVLMEEAGRCYVHAGGYSTVAMCQAVTESLLRRIASGSEDNYHKLLNKLRGAGILSPKEAHDMNWLSSLRNPFLHTGSQRKYAKAASRSVMPVISDGTVTQRVLLESDCKRALKLTISLLHHLCCDTEGGSLAVVQWMTDIERYRQFIGRSRGAMWRPNRKTA